MDTIDRLLLAGMIIAVWLLTVFNAQNISDLEKEVSTLKGKMEIITKGEEKNDCKL